MTSQDNSFPIIRAGHDHWPGFLTKKNPTEEPGYDILWKVFPHTLSKDKKFINLSPSCEVPESHITELK